MNRESRKEKLFDKQLVLLQENYPQLKANENFLKLQDSLEGTENRIAVERMRYNESVKALNTSPMRVSESPRSERIAGAAMEMQTRSR